MLERELEALPLPPLKRRRPSSELSLSLTLSPSPSSSPTQSRSSPLPSPEEQGVRLIQFILSSAAALEASDVGRADSLLRSAAALSSSRGDPLQRLAARLTAAMARSLLSVLRLPGVEAALRGRVNPPGCYIAYARALPYIPFANSAAAHAILRAAAGERHVHFLDLGVSHASADLWVPVLRSLASKTDPHPHVRLTLVSPDPAMLETLSARLSEEADRLDLPLQINLVASDLNDFDPSTLLLRSGEALAVVSVLGLHRLLSGDAAAMEEFLTSLRRLRPKVMAVAEQEASPAAAGGPVVEALYYYGAVYDSLGAAAAAVGEEERDAAEEAVGAEVEAVVTGEVRHQGKEFWAARISSAGFRQGRVWCEEAIRLAESWTYAASAAAAGGGGAGYKVVADKGFLVICWHDRPLYSVSAWVS